MADHQFSQLDLAEITACLKLIRWRAVSLRSKIKAFKVYGSFHALMDLQKIDWQVIAKKALEEVELPNAVEISQDMDWLLDTQFDQRYFIPMGHQEYPQALTHLTDAPLGLFVVGDKSGLSSPQIAIVGSRNHTPSGQKITTQIVSDLCAAGLGVTSGMALGIDTFAHQECCSAKGYTIAVFGCGLDRIYPRQNTQLAKNIIVNGCIISEFPIGTPPKRENFPARNRIISGLSLAVIVVEAAQRSGSLITARLAAEQGKEVFAVPGSILSSQSQGCNSLIQQGASLYRNFSDFMFDLKIPLENSFDKQEFNDKNQNLSESLVSSCPVLEAIAYDETSIDEIINQLDIEFQNIATRLIELELDGLIKRGHNGRYSRL